MSKLKFALIACICAVAGIVATVAQAAPGDTLGVSTLIQRILPNGSGNFKTLTTGPGEGYMVRDGSEVNSVLGQAKAGRETRRVPLAYFGQLTDFQLADEESPARVEFLDPLAGKFTASWRPSEAFNPQEANEMIEQMNAFAANAPVASGDGSKPPMDFVMNTGDISDSQQYNETVWNRTLIEGGTLNPGSGVDPTSSIGTNPLCPAAQITALGGIKDSATPTNYTGVQDRDDWPNAQEYYFYDPDDPNPPKVDPGNVNPYEDAPQYPGLMNQAQKPFTATGLDVPGYVLFGNHDGLVQGNAWASKLFNQFAQGCLKPIADKAPENSGFDPFTFLGLVTNPNLDVPGFLNLVDNNPDQFMAVPPDPDRRLIAKTEYMDIFKASNEDDGHGFGFVDPAEAAASNGTAGYYAYSKGGVRYITLDTHSEGGKILVSSEGNLDTPQYNWFENELKKATADNEIAIVFSHHAPESMNADVPDEDAPQCADVNPDEVVGCDGDPRTSTPIKLKDDLFALMHKYPIAVAWVAGHSHENKVIPYKDPAGKGGFWSIRSSALVDWPKQNRLVQIFDNQDGNLSIFGTLIDHAAPVPAPAAGTNAGTFTAAQLASTGRTIGYNDNQNGGGNCTTSPDPCGAGTPADRNVELLITDPRRPVVPPVLRPNISKVKVFPNRRVLRAGKRTKLLVRVTNSGNAPATRVKLNLRSFNRQVKVRRKLVIKRIPAKRTLIIRGINVRATGKARGRARVVAAVGKRKGSSVLKIKAKKRRSQKRR